MGMAKKEIFNTQSKFFCQLDEINKIFVFRDKVCLFCGGVGGFVFNILSSHSFFSFCCPFLQPVLLPTLLTFLCAEFWLVTLFQEKGKEQQVNSKIPHMLIAC